MKQTLLRLTSVRPLRRQAAAMALLAAAATVVLPACETVRTSYYNAWESVGYDKRERLVDDVKDARDAQGEAKDQFVTALEEFKSLVDYDGGNLENVYNQLNGEFEAAAEEAEEVYDQIAQVERVGKALFDEWQGEIGQISDPELVRASEKLYRQTERRFEDLVSKMNDAAATMEPVLTKFRDRVLFLKTNLNAQAIASLEGVSVDLTRDIEELIQEMESSIAEADAFIAELEGPSGDDD